MSFDFGTKLLKKKEAPAAPKKAAAKPAPRAPVRSTQKVAAPEKARSGGAGYRKYSGDALWLPSATRPAWLDGSLPGDRGFDPLGLAKPVEYLQYDVDSLDQNQAVNKKGEVVGAFRPDVDQVSTDKFQPYSEVFGLQRFRECELMHGRWAMLGALGVIVAESATGLSWTEAISKELAQPGYLKFDLPYSMTAVTWLNVFAVGQIEGFRNAELDLEKRIYPGGAFDPLGLATPGKADADQVQRLREAEIKHGRLAMVAFFGFTVQALAFGKGAFQSLESFSANL